MGKRYNLSGTEFEIMEFLWQSDRIYNTSELLAHFNEGGKNWKRQTLNTLITRLENKGFIKREWRLVHPILTEKEYRQLQGQELLDNMYGGKVGNLIAALVKDEVNEADITELENLIHKLKSGE